MTIKRESWRRIKMPLIAAVIASGLPSATLAQPQSDARLQGGYSVAPLQKPIFDREQVVAETEKLNDWLRHNVQKLSYEQMKGPREHLYYLIDSRVKHIYAEQQRVLPEGGDRILETLFFWAEYLGVYGGAHAFNAVRIPGTQARNPGMEVPAGFELQLHQDVFTVRSDVGWSVSFPYYFMIWSIGHSQPDGVRTELLALSTGATKDKSELGHSQATLMVLFSPGRKLEAFEDFWRKQLGIPAELKPQQLGIKGLTSRHVVDEMLRLHKEFTAWSDASGSYGVAYLGIEGTYEWNRPHFLDLLRSMTTKSE